jgi:hypothetical protein
MNYTIVNNTNHYSHFMRVGYIVIGGIVLFLIVVAMARLHEMQVAANNNVLQSNNILNRDSDNSKNYGNMQDEATLTANYGMSLEMTKWLGSIQTSGFIGAFISGGVLLYGIFSGNNRNYSQELVGEKVSDPNSRDDPYLQEMKIKEWNSERFPHQVR